MRIQASWSVGISTTEDDGEVVRLETGSTFTNMDAGMARHMAAMLLLNADMIERRVGALMEAKAQRKEE